MKKAVSVLLVVLLMLNVMGYYGLFLGLKYKNSLRVSRLIDEQDYDEEQTITIKIPLAIPYYGDTGYERVDGEIEHDGQFYRLIKQKYEQDTLYVVCMRDTRAEHIHEALGDYVKTFSDQSTDRPSKSVQPLIKDYFPSNLGIRHSATGWSVQLYFANSDGALLEPHHSLFAPPPRA